MNKVIKKVLALTTMSLVFSMTSCDLDAILSEFNNGNFGDIIQIPSSNVEDSTTILENSIPIFESSSILESSDNTTMPDYLGAFWACEEVFEKLRYNNITKGSTVLPSSYNTQYNGIKYEVDAIWKLGDITDELLGKSVSIVTENNEVLLNVNDDNLKNGIYYIPITLELVFMNYYRFSEELTFELYVEHKEPQEEIILNYAEIVSNYVFEYYLPMDGIVKDKITLPNELGAKDDYGNSHFTTVKWSIDCDESNFAHFELITESEMNSTLFVPKKDHFYDSFDVTFSCVIEDEYGNKIEIGKTIMVPGIVMNTYEEYLEACNSKSDETINIKAYIADQHVKQTASGYGSLYLIDENGNSYYVYNPMYSIDLGDLELFLSTYAVGKEVLVSGKCDVYAGWHEFAKGASVYLTGESIDTNHELLKHFDATETFYSAYSSKDAETLLPYESKQVIINDCVCVSNDGRYIYFTIRDGQTQFLIYNQSYLITPEEGTAFFNSIAVGDTFNLKGIVAVYGGAYQIYLNTPNAIEITKKAEVNIETPVE